MGAMRVLVFGVVLGACAGKSTTTPDQPVRPVRKLVPAPPTDQAGFRRLLVGDVVNGGLWFVDAACREQFLQPGPVPAAAFDAFAACVAGLKLRATGRIDGLDDTSVLTDDNGFEIEAHVVGGKLDFIGYSGRAPGAPDLPTITPKTLESLRTGGDPNATISEAEAKTIPSNPNNEHTEHLRLCLSETGELASITPAGTVTSPTSLNAYTAIARTWKFRPFTVGGKAINACAIIGFQYPESPPNPDRDLLPRPLRSKAGNVIYKVKPSDVTQMSGAKMVFPDDEDKVLLRNGSRTVGSFKLCLDEQGRYESGTLLKSTGLARYDAKIARTMMAWTYQPYVLDGVAVPVCFVLTFVYSQGH
jgi:hypothetical protein